MIFNWMDKKKCKRNPTFFSSVKKLCALVFSVAFWDGTLISVLRMQNVYFWAFLSYHNSRCEKSDGDILLDFHLASGLFLSSTVLNCSKTTTRYYFFFPFSMD